MYWNTHIKLTAAATAPLWCCQKIYLFTKKWKKSALNEKVCFSAFYHFNNFFGTHGHITAVINFLDLILSVLLHSQSPQHSKTYLQNLKTKPETCFILSFLGTKRCRTEKLRLKTLIFRCASISRSDDRD